MRRAGEQADAAPSHVLQFATLGAPERRRLTRRRRAAPPEPEPTPVSTGRATVISVSDPFADVTDARRWLKGAGERRLAGDLVVLNRALHAFRLVTADASVHAVDRSQLLVARLGYGDGEHVAEGRWSEALELTPAPARSRRAKLLEPQAQLAAALGGRQPALVCAELALRARLDVDHERWREAALQLSVAFDAALSELAAEDAIADRVDGLRGRQAAVAAAARSALTGEIGAEDREAIAAAVAALEAALRARAFARA